MSQYAISLENLTLGWNKKAILADLNGQFMPGSITAVVGPNGSGKSTLIKALASLIKPMQGCIHIAPEYQHSIALLPQSTQIDRHFPMTTYELVAMGAWPRVGMLKAYGSQEKEKIWQALERVGLSKQARALIGSLSGGQLQRALFARLMMQEAHIMLLDEPFAAVDEQTIDDLMEVIHQWHEEGRTLIVVLHDAQLVKKQFAQAMLLARQLVSWGPTNKALSEENLAKARSLSLGGF